MPRNFAQSSLLRRIIAWLSPPVPGHIASALQQAQYDSVRRQVPMLLAVAALNTAILMAVCAHEGMPWSTYGWLSLLIVYCAIRIASWVRRRNKPPKPEDIRRLLAFNIVAALSMISMLGVITAWTFAAGTFQAMLLVPMSLGFGAVSIAHCLYTLRPAAIGTVVMGLFPSSVAMILIGPYEAQMLALAMTSVGALMIRFVAAQYDQLVESLLLAHENRRLAMTDPLTALANRRATMAALEQAMAGDAPFAVALMDLDGFKQVNDRLGHHAGDALLVEVARRLVDAAGTDDHVGRLGGDEFCVLLRDAGSESDCAARCTALLATLGRPVLLDGQPLQFGASLGYAVHGLHGDTAEALLHGADQALYAAKRGTSDAIGMRAVKLAA